MFSQTNWQNLTLLNDFTKSILFLIDADNHTFNIEELFNTGRGITGSRCYGQEKVFVPFKHGCHKPEKRFLYQQLHCILKI